MKSKRSIYIDCCFSAAETQCLPVLTVTRFFKTIHIFVNNLSIAFSNTLITISVNFIVNIDLNNLSSLLELFQQRYLC